MKKLSSEKIICILCFAIMGFLMMSIVAGTIDRKILHRDTHFALNASSQPQNIQWNVKYPFKNNNLAIEHKKTESFITKANRIANSIKGKVQVYTSQKLFGYLEMTELARDYQNLIHWNYTFYGEYNGIIELKDGYLTNLVPQTDISAESQSMLQLSDFCKDHQARLLYVQAPYKISPVQDADISGTMDYSNQNADNLLQSLRDMNIETLDLRDSLKSSTNNYHQLFYRTDHHWLPETALTSSQIILQYLSDHFDRTIDPSILDKHNFNFQTFPGWFLGSQGKKMTLSVASPEDFTLIFPKNETRFHYQIPEFGLDKVGDFSITYDMSQVDEKDYYALKSYHSSMYHAYNYGQRALIRIENLKLDSPHKVLLIRDSFSDCMISFLAMGLKHLDIIDLRTFNGSVQTLIETEKPDLVIVLYNPNMLNHPDPKPDRSPYDFR